MAEKRRRKESETNLLGLPPDVLNLILSQVEYEFRLTLSLVCKSFRSLTHGLVHKLYFYNGLPSNSAFRKVFARFSSVSRIAIRSARIARALTAIANSALKIEGLEIYGKPSFPKLEQIVSLSGKFGEVKTLKFGWFCNASELQVVEFVNLFPSLEELDLGGCLVWSDIWMEKLVLKAPNLRKVNLGRNHDVTDRSLDVLSNCVNLEHVCLKYCGRITLQGFCAFVRKSKNLKCLEVPYDLWPTTLHGDDDIQPLAESISACENLSHLSISELFMRDDFLSVIANLCSPLTSLELKGHVPSGYTMTGLSAMHRVFQGLTRLHLYLPYGGPDIQDMEVSQLVKSLPRLKDVILVLPNAPYATLFSLIHNCSLLESINIEYWKGKAYCDVPMVTKNYNVHCIIVYPEPVYEEVVV